MALDTNLVSYWKLDEASGNAADSVGSNTLTNNGTMPYGAAKLNNGAQPASSGSKYLSIVDGSQSGLDLGTSDFTIAFWLKSNSYVNGVELIEKQFISGSNYYQVASGGTANRVRFEITGGIQILNSVNVFDNAFHHIVAVRSGNNLIIYTDGGNAQSTTGASGVNVSSDGTFFVGHGNNGTLTGTIDELGIWSRALSAGEVSSLYNSGAGLAYPFVTSATATHTLDALLKKAQSATHTIDGLLKKAVTSTHTLDALLKKARSATHTVDSFIALPTPTLTHTISSFLKRPTKLIEKTVLARVSLPSGLFLTTWKNINFRGFTKQLNGGLGECALTYAVPFDYDGSDLREGNDVELTISDRDTLNSTDNDGEANVRTVYRGYISLIDRRVDGSEETVTVHLLGYYTLLAQDVLKEDAQTTLYSEPDDGLTVTEADLDPADIGLMARTVLDRFAEESGSSKVYYAGTTDIPDTGTDSTYTFQQKTYREAIDKLKELAPQNVYWYVDATGRFTFGEMPSEPTHRFIFGRHFASVRVERSLEKVRNVVQIWNGDAIYKNYQDNASVDQYGRRVERINDYGISDEDAADAAGAKFLTENKDPAVKLICTVIDNNNAAGLGYDIEDIEPGDTCAFQGFSSELSDIFRDNMLITKVSYTLEAAEIEVELVRSGLVDVQARQSRDIADIGSGGLGIPASYS